jgi:photosystem II stability/assembly factor-like uncharacterized protein
MYKRLLYFSAALVTVVLGVYQFGRLRQISHPDSLQTSSPDPLAKKMEPSDWFQLQRSWPDATFNESSWLQRIAEAQQTTEFQKNGSAPNWILQGAGNIPGRVNTLCLHPTNPDILLAGFATGGIYKTINGGDSWYPVFDQMPLLGIADLTFDPQNPNIVYAATGDPQMTINPVNGFGLFKSTDGGETWAYLALNDVGIITKIEVNRTNSQILYAAVQGNPFQRNEKRGVYKSTDGGQTWQRVHFVSTQAGVSDMVMHPTNSNILYASYWERIRTNSESFNYGTDAKIFKTTDGGLTWQQLMGGLPTGVLCRTGLAISTQNPDKLYAVYVDTTFALKGIYKTTDGGTAWTALNTLGLSNIYANFGWYFGKIRLNPANDEEISALGVILRKRILGTDSWVQDASVHADVHDLVYLPNGTRFVASDGGIYRNKVNDFTWELCDNMATTQFYHLAHNPHQPAQYWGGAQDNGTAFGSAATGANNWTSRFGADGFDVAFHPTDPNIIWVQSQNGGVHLSTDGGANFNFNNNCLGTTDRCGWDTPIFKSPHDAGKLYSGTYRFYVSPSANFLSWSPISPDLTDGVIFGPRFHVISTVSESPIQLERLFAGTSDGNVWIKTPQTNWTNITGSLPNRFVTSVKGSPTDQNRIFVTHSGLRDNEATPHIHRSDNQGNTWVDISGNLPDVPVNDLLIVPNQGDLVLVAATDAGVYRTLDGGNNWTRLAGNLPNVVIADVELNTQRQEVAIATFGRGIYTLPLADVLIPDPVQVVVQIGTVRTAYPTPLPVANVRASVSGQYLSSTNAAGFAALVNPPASGDITLSKDTLPLNGVDLLDVLLIQRHILGLTPLSSPYKILAGDVNNSKTLTAGDIVAMRKVILGAQPSFAVPSWQFVPADFAFSNPLNPWLTTYQSGIPIQTLATGRKPEWIAVKSGDLDGNASTQNAAPWRADDRKFEKVSLCLDEEAENTLILSIDAAAQLEGAQGTLETSHEIESVEVLHPSLSGCARLVDAHRLAFCFTTLQLGAHQKDLFRIKYKTLHTELAASDWRLTESVTPIRAIVLGGADARVEICRRRNKTDLNGLLNVQLGANPLPISHACVVRVRCSAPYCAQVFDAQGALMYDVQNAENEQFTIPAAALSKAGIYFVRVEANGMSRVERLVVL